MKTLLFLLGLVFTFNTHAALLETRLGGLAIYDPDANLTWVRDAGLSGPGNWNDAQIWVDSLVIDGFGDWRLPSSDVNGDGNIFFCDFAIFRSACLSQASANLDNELSFLVERRQIYPNTPEPFFNIDIGVNENSNSTVWWTSTVSSIPDNIETFAGITVPIHESFENGYVWAVADGDIGGIGVIAPVPAAVWLFGSGLIGLIGLAKKKK